MNHFYQTPCLLLQLRNGLKSARMLAIGGILSILFLSLFSDANGQSFVNGREFAQIADKVLAKNLIQGRAVPTSITIVSDNPTGVCEGSPVKFTATVTATGTDPLTGTVQFFSDGVAIGGLLPVDGAGNASFTTSALTALGSPHVISATYNADNADPNNDQSTTNPDVTQVINPIPATPVPTNTGPACVGSNVTLKTATVTGASYSWTGPNGYTSGTQNPVLSNVALTDGGDYSVTVTVGTCTSAAGTTTVVVNK